MSDHDFWWWYLHLGSYVVVYSVAIMTMEKRHKLSRHHMCYPWWMVFTILPLLILLIWPAWLLIADWQLTKDSHG